MDTLAIREGLDLAMDLHEQNIIISCDNGRALKELDEKRGGAQAAIVKEITSRLPVFNSFNFKSSSSSSVKHAKNLAKFLITLPLGRHMWLLSPHDESCIPVNVVV